MKNQTSHKKSIQSHIKSIERKIGRKPQYKMNSFNKQNQIFIESDAENDSSDLSSEQQQQYSKNTQNYKETNAFLKSTGRNTQNQQKNFHQNQKQNKPAKFYQILQLPTAQYKKTQKQLDLCSICLQQWQERQTYKILPCTHVLHLNCAKDWLTQKNQCPLCKLKIFHN